ncbi:MAG: TetR/AcrR family transcriptional regulator [bacterium]
MRTKEGNKDKDILEAAIKVFAETGYHKSKISKIAEIAGVATGSVYVYYKSKEEILYRIFNDIWENLYHELFKLTSNPSIPALEKLDSMIDLILDVFTQNPAMALVIVNEQQNVQRTSVTHFTDYYEKFLDLATGVIQEGIKEGVISKNIDLYVFRFYIFGAVRNILNNWALNQKEFPLNKIRQSIKYFTKNGIIVHK